MNKLGEVLLNEQTRVTISIATLLIVIGFSITATFTFTTWKTKFESQLEYVDTQLVEEITERKLADEELMDEYKETKSLLIGTQTNLVEIQTDLKWIKSFLMNNE
jgi:hypothetical protein